MCVLDILKNRGFIEKQTHDAELEAYLGQKGARCYIGFDPTADSLHVGHLIPIMSLAHMQRCGHRPIALVGGGTGMIGDPSGKTEMRKMMTAATIGNNVNAIQAQLSRFVDFDDGALLVNNADWLAGLELIPFLRDVGRHFSVNRMIKAESYRQRIESEEGLNFIEFNYMLLQSFDFLKLFDNHNCRLQMGGSDQWGNIIAGADLVRRKRQETVFGITFRLITKSDGSKMGKSASGAVWLDPEKTSPYEYYQFWINTDDRDVSRFIALFTFLPLAEIKALERLSGADLNCAKTILAFEATVLAHGREDALTAHAAAAGAFGGRKIPHGMLPSSGIPRERLADTVNSLPTTLFDRNEIAGGIPAYQLFQRVGLARSAGEARRLIGQNGAYINENRVVAFDFRVGPRELRNGEIVLRAGKKRYHRIVLDG
ncbi:tyrosine--tRNA ligase [Desulfosarcina alkanivorans]|uniref:Tyrosine--tRNA ligase n=1 Tax=Desulfosarcina alkanivorans TaxID=571177 RepID=A0A5K7YW89_9BACT|nr:tyrosine--tRNA ligase [Desulfosarcina alkanivorans]BBO72263.1 tyrosine--tRNA ligase [Desulfosarcina alkanivorans]